MIFDHTRKRRFTSGQSRQPREARAERRKRGAVRDLGKRKKKEKESLRRSRFRPPRVSSRTSALLSCGPPQGHWFAEGISPPFAKCWCVRHSLHLATISSWCVSRSSCRSARRGIEPSRVPRRDGRSSLGRVCRQDEETRPRVRERSRTRLSSRGRFRGATQFRRLAREASTAARSPVSAGDSARARRRRARLGFDDVPTGYLENASPQRGIFQSARGEFAREVHFMVDGLPD